MLNIYERLQSLAAAWLATPHTLVPAAKTCLSLEHLQTQAVLNSPHTFYTLLIFSNIEPIGCTACL